MPRHPSRARVALTSAFLALCLAGGAALAQQGNLPPSTMPPSGSPPPPTITPGGPPTSSPDVPPGTPANDQTLPKKKQRKHTGHSGSTSTGDTTR